MAVHTIIGYDIGDWILEDGGSPYTATIGDRVRLPSDWSVSTDGITYQITDDDPDLEGDVPNDEIGADGTQSVVTTDAGGAPLPDGQLYIEEAVTLTDGEGHDIVVYVLEIGGTFVGAIATEPIVPGTFYEITTIQNVDGSNAPDYVSLESGQQEAAWGQTYQGGGFGDSLEGGDGADVIYGEGGADTISGGAQNDVLYGGGGGDTLLGDAGNDYISGDDSTDFMASESLNWSAAGPDDSQLLSGFTQNTGEMDVTVSLVNDGNNNPSWWIESSDITYTQPGEPMSDRSSLDMSGSGDGATSTTRIEFAASGASSAEDEVENVVFRINDIDGSAGNWQDIVTVTAYDTLGNPVSVSLTAAGDDSVAGNTVTASTGSQGDHDDAQGSVLVEIQGPVQRVDISYSNGLTAGQNIWITDVHFDVMEPSAGGDDSITGGLGADTIEGGAGADTIHGNEDGDTIYYGEGGATQADGDLVYGGDGADMLDDVSGFAHTYDNTLYGEAGNDTIYDGSGNSLVDGGTENDALFGELGDDTLYGQSGDDWIDAGDGADVAEGGDGADTILGGAGDDTITGGAGNDSLTGGSGDDTFVLADGSGADTITDFDIGDSDSDGFFNDQFSVTGLHDLQGNTVHAGEVAVSDDGSGNALLTFPNGETVVLLGVAPSAIDQPAELQAAGIPCFCEGTRIMTPSGEQMIETLRRGQLVTTLDRGPQPILWIGRRDLSADELDRRPSLRPVRIRDGTLGNKGDLLISPQHAMRLPRRVLPNHATGVHSHGLVRAVHLLRLGDGRFRRAMGRRKVSYFHLLLPRHTLVLANNAWSETLYPGPMGLSGFDRAAKAELFSLFPQLSRILQDKTAVGPLYGDTALPFLRPGSLAPGARLRLPRAKAVTSLQMGNSAVN